MKVIKRNQVVIFVIALMLVTAGYLNFIGTSKIDNSSVQTSADSESIGDATLVSSNALVENEEDNKNENTVEEIADAASSEAQKEETKTSTQPEEVKKETLDEYFVTSKLERDNMYSQIIDSYQKMIEKETVTAEQKAIAQNEITKINNTKNGIMITENLIKTKGFKDVVILVNGESINVIISNDDLKQDEVAQIQNIVSREMSAEIENIHISSK